MSRKVDLEQSIRECYDIIRDYEKIIETTDRPEEKGRARREMQDRWELIEAYLEEYRVIAEGEQPSDIAEIAARFSSETTSSPSEPPASPVPTVSGSRVGQRTPTQRFPWRWVLRVISILIVIASIVWLIIQPGPEPVVGILSAIGTMIASLVGEEHGADEPSSSITSGVSSKIPDESATPRPRIVNLRPLDATHSFKDREREIEALLKYLSADGVRLISIVGRGGMGKTALACRVLADLEQGVLRVPGEDRELTIDGILYLSARSTGLSLDRIYSDVERMMDEPTANTLRARWADEDTPIAAKVEYLLEAMQGGLYLILLDNLEDGLAEDDTIAEEGLRTLVERCLIQPTGARLIVTSREQVSVAGAGLHNMRCIDLLEGLPYEASISLLRELDPQGLLSLRDAAEGDLRRAAQSTSGIPRALEIIAGILHRDRTTTLRELLDNQAIFGAQVVERLVAEGYRRLGEDDQRVMEALAVFDTPVNEEAIAYLLNPWFPDLDVRDGLRDLVNGHFVRISSATRQYSLHPLDREYSYRRLPRDEKESSYSQHNLELCAADYYASIRKPESKCKSIDDLAPQLAEFEHRVRAEDYEDAYRVVDTTVREQLYEWGHFSVLVEMHTKLEPGLTDPHLQARNLGQAGIGYYALGQHSRAIDLLSTAVELAHQIADRADEALWLGFLGSTYRHLEQHDCAIQSFQEAQTIMHDLGDRPGEGYYIGSLGRVYHDLGQIERAVGLYNQSLAICQERDLEQEGKWLGQQGKWLGQERRWLRYLSEAYLALGEIDKAIEHSKQSLTVSRKAKRSGHGEEALRILGLAYRDCGQVEKAIEHLKGALNAVRQVGYRRGEVRCLRDLGTVYSMLGQANKAIELHAEALHIARGINYRQEESYQLVGLGRARLAAGALPGAQQCEEARHAFADAEACCRAMLGKTIDLYEARYTVAVALVGQAVCDPRWTDACERAKLDEYRRALDEYHRALDTCSAKGVVQNAIRDLELIRAAGIEGLEPVFELLESAIENEPD